MPAVCVSLSWAIELPLEPLDLRDQELFLVRELFVWNECQFIKQ
jgi:hypothetical protein